MTTQERRSDAYLRAMLDVLAAPTAQRDASTTLWRRNVFTLVIAISAGCSGNTSQTNYARGVEVQEACCENVPDATRDQCLREVVRVADPNAQTTATNEQTYRCVVDLFVCDPASGHETPASAQAQHDCIEELQQ